MQKQYQCVRNDCSDVETCPLIASGDQLPTSHDKNVSTFAYQPVCIVYSFQDHLFDGLRVLKQIFDLKHNCL